jgi:hypothetical protein
MAKTTAAARQSRAAMKQVPSICYSRGMRRTRVFVIMGCLLGATLVIGSAVRVERAELRWSVADLDPVPEPQTNGWAMLAEIERVPALPSDLQDWVGILASIDAVSTWKMRPTDAAAISAFVRQPEVAEILRVWHAAAAQPHFVDGCALDFDSSCPDLRLYQIHQIAAIEVLDHVLREDWATAVEATGKMLEVSANYSSSARTLLGAMTSVASHALALALLDVVDYSAPYYKSEPWHARKMLDTLVRHAAVELTLRPAVIGEYLRVVDMLRRVASRELDPVHHESWLPRWLFHRDRTVHRINAAFDDYLACAEVRSASASASPHPPPGTLTDRLLNPVGEQLFSLLLPTVFPVQCERHHEKIAELRARRVELIERLSNPRQHPHDRVR